MAVAPNLPPVLVVDNDEDDLHLIKRLMGKGGVKNPVVTFDDPSKAVAFLKAALAMPNGGLMPCAVFTDLKMPRMDGFELIAWIRGEKALTALSVVMLSSSSFEKDIKRAKALGVDNYLVKLPTPETMAKIVADACRRSRK
jgi:CheY-like chemotaxis protein